MFRFFFAALAFALLAGGFALLVLDGTRSIAASEVTMTSLGQAIEWLAPDRLAALRKLIETNLYPWLWDPALTTALRAPAGLALALLGALIAILAGRRAPEIGHSSR